MSTLNSTLTPFRQRPASSGTAQLSASTWLLAALPVSPTSRPIPEHFIISCWLPTPRPAETRLGGCKCLSYSTRSSDRGLPAVWDRHKRAFFSESRNLGVPWTIRETRSENKIHIIPQTQHGVDTLTYTICDHLRISSCIQDSSP